MSEYCRRFVESGDRSSLFVKSKDCVSGCRLSESFESHISFQCQRGLVKGKPGMCARDTREKKKGGRDRPIRMARDFRMI